METVKQYVEEYKVFLQDHPVAAVLSLAVAVFVGAFLF